MQPIIAWIPQNLGTAGLEYLGLGILLVALAILLLLFSLLSRLRQPDERLEKLDTLERIEATLSRIAESHADLDLRRVEHALLDIRNGQRRFEERMLATLDAANQQREALVPVAPPLAETPVVAVGDRVMNRLLALGYERVELLTTGDELEKLAREDGDVVVEARRDGALHKGRVVLKGGVIAEVKLRASYEIFP